LAQANWPDNGPTGPDVDYGTDGTNKLTMTLAGATTSSAWMNGARLNLNADNTTSITDSALNKADKNNANIAITGLNGPIIGYPGAENITSSSATISWTTGSNTTGNRVLYDTKANYESSYSLGQQSVAGYPGDGTRNHSIEFIWVLLRGQSIITILARPNFRKAAPKAHLQHLLQAIQRPRQLLASRRKMKKLMLAQVRYTLISRNQ